jgi:phosphoribosylanthranilate isomerase
LRYFILYMYKSKIKISDIQNLTDARYFAAMDVDYLGFCCNPGSETFCAVSKIKEIKEWVQGPEFVLQFQGFQREEEIKALVDEGLGSALHFGIFATYDSDFGVPVFKEWIFENLTPEDYLLYDFPIIRSDKSYDQLREREKQSLSRLLELKLGYLDFRWSVYDLDQMISDLPPFGLILRGGEEERVGVKSFDQMDEIFEFLSVAD